MKVSQLTYVMEKGAPILVYKPNGDVVYDGSVGGTKKDDPVNKMYVTYVGTVGGTIFVCAVEPTNKRGGRR